MADHLGKGKGGKLKGNHVDDNFGQEWYCQPGKGVPKGYKGFRFPIYAPASVPDDDGQEHVLVHVVGISGNWLWSGILPEYTRMTDFQRTFQIEMRHNGDGPLGLYKLVWQWYRRCCEEGLSEQSHERSSYLLVCDQLSRVTGVRRSEETQEVWITAIKTNLYEAPHALTLCLLRCALLSCDDYNSMPVHVLCSMHRDMCVHMYGLRVNVLCVENKMQWARQVRFPICLDGFHHPSTQTQ